MPQTGAPHSGPGSSAARSPPGSTTSRSSKACRSARTCSRNWCEAHSVPFRILSDGFDWNLDRLQSLNGIHFAYTSNHLRVEHGKWRIRAGAPDPTCGCGTGMCKGNVLRTLRAASPRTHLVHIGNGRVSDFCGALAADTAFAKDSLAEWLAARGVPFISFTTLDDVIPHLAAILDRAER
ncbi:MAG: hypothetical protein E6J87_11325 [Deltaproteobacteria bacterium]|nr:MAG: hypothetical protein E6J87_11325 [Deltaproteobacteria bacterium]